MVNVGVNSTGGTYLIPDEGSSKPKDKSESAHIGVWRSVYFTLFLINIGLTIASAIQLIGGCPDKTVYGLLYHLVQLVLNIVMICAIARKADDLDSYEDFFVKRFRAMRWVHLVWALSGIIVYVLLQAQATDANICTQFIIITTLIYPLCTLSIIIIGHAITKLCY